MIYGLFCVFRGFQDNTDKILINTDARTRKVINFYTQFIFRSKFWNLLTIQYVFFFFVPINWQFGPEIVKLLQF